MDCNGRNVDPGQKPIAREAVILILDIQFILE